MRTFRTLSLTLAALSATVSAQAPFSLEIEKVVSVNAPAIHSMAVGKHDGQWLFVAGRTDGLHLLFGGEAFPADMANNNVLVFDPDADQAWSASLDELPDEVADPLRTTNGQYWQDGTRLYVTGGYGYSNAANEKRTFGVLTAIDVPEIISAVQNATPLSPHIRQTTDERLTVAGGHLIRFEGRYYLVGGNRFDGEYLGEFSQEYTNAVRSFEIDDDGETLGISSFEETVDAENLHRRDLNVGPVILDDGSEGFAIYGGVFRTDVNLPFRSPIYFDGGSFSVNSGFEAYFGHYTSPLIPLYDDGVNPPAMHSIFVGGMNQFFFDETDGQIKEDVLVPFVDDVTLLSRFADGSTVETVLPVTLPGLLGTNAAFFFDPALPRYENGVIQLRALEGRTLLGRMIGGIASDMPNAGWLGGVTSASDRMFEFYLTVTTVGVENDRPDSFDILPAAPNPFGDETRIGVHVSEPQEMVVHVFDLLGRRVSVLHEGLIGAGSHSFRLEGGNLPAGVYLVRISGAGRSVSQQVIHTR